MISEVFKNLNFFPKDFESLCSQFYGKLKDSSEETEKIRLERDEFKNRLEQRDKDQSKMDSKIKALEKVINTNNFRTPLPSNKENRGQFVTPSRNNSGGSVGGVINGGTGSSTGGSYVQGANDRPPSSSSVPKTPITSGMKCETPVVSTYRSSRITHTALNQVTNGRNHVFGAANSQMPPPTPSKEGVIVANKRNTRRSKSAEMWLDHRPLNLAKIGKIILRQYLT